MRFWIYKKNSIINQNAYMHIQLIKSIFDQEITKIKIFNLATWSYTQSCLITLFPRINILFN